METTQTRRHAIARHDMYAAAAVVMLTLVAAAVRIHALDLGPQALYRDEAQNGLDALSVLGGARPIFFEANNGREPLFVYLAALSVALLGRTPDALRLVSVVAGTLMIPALYWLGRELFSRRVGLWTAALAVTTVWMLNLSRVAFRAGLLPLVAAFALAACWRACRLRSVLWAAGGGALLGLCLYTYLAARLIPLALGLYLLWCWLDRRTRAETWWRGWAVITVAALVVGTPMLIYLVQTGGLLSRSDQVSVLNPSINGGDLCGTLARNLLRTARMLVYGGDFIPRHNVPLRAVFTPVVALAAYGGAGVLVWRSRRDCAARLMLVWLCLMALPTVLAENAPHFLRAVGILPAAMLLPAVGLEAAIQRLPGRGGRVALAAVALLFGASALSDWSAYRAHLASQVVYYRFETGAAELAAQVNRYLGNGWQGAALSVSARDAFAGREAWIERRLWDSFPSIAYLVASPEQVRLLDEGESAPETQSQTVLAILWPYVDQGKLWATLPREWQWTVTPGAWEQGDLEPEPRMLYLSLEGEASPDFEGTPDITFEDGLALLDTSAAPAADDATRLSLVMRWRADGKPGQGYSAFAHVLCDGVPAGQSDGSPGGEWFPTSAWRPGDFVVDRRTIELTRAWDPLACSVQIGLYRWQDGVRLTVLATSGYEVRDDAVLIGGAALGGAN
jgi:4-amino-4-deoxy-L-arabinose transferase-like glycosyltransferase